MRKIILLLAVLNSSFYAVFAQPVANPASLTTCMFYDTPRPSFAISGCHHYSYTSSVAGQVLYSTPTGVGGAVSNITNTGTLYFFGNASTTFTITGYNANNSICGTTNVPVTVNPLPTVQDYNASNGIGFCLGENTILTLDSPQANVVYTWASNSPSAGLSSSTGTSVTATPTAVGTYTITVTGTNTVTGCKTEVSNIPLYIDGYPVLKLTSPAEVTSCRGQIVKVTYTISGKGGVVVATNPGSYLSSINGPDNSVPGTELYIITVPNATIGSTITYNFVPIGNSGCMGPELVVKVKVVACSALPVSWVSFTGQSTNNQNELRWQTAEEVQNKGFEVERSGNARSFERIGFVAGANDSKASQTYSFTDSQPQNGTNYYRLKQLDNDGQFSYSRIIAVVQEGAEAFLVYPNPVVDVVTIKNREGTLNNVQLLDSRGSLLTTQLGTNNEVSLSLHNQPAGTYMVVMEIDGYLFSKKIIKF